MRYRFDGKEKTASLGKYPETSLAEAREKRDQMRKQVAKEIDPVQAQQAVKQAKQFAQENSFETVARAWGRTQQRDWRKAGNNRRVWMKQ